MRGNDVFSVLLVNNPGHIIESFRPREVQYFYLFKQKPDPNIFRPT